MRLEFGKRQLDGIEIRAVRRQVVEPTPRAESIGLIAMDFVGGKVVEDERVPLVQLRTEHLLKISHENLGIHGAVHQKRGLQAFMAQGGHEGGTLPVAVRDGAQAALANGQRP